MSDGGRREGLSAIGNEVKGGGGRSGGGRLYLLLMFYCLCWGYVGGEGGWTVDVEWGGGVDVEWGGGGGHVSCWTRGKGKFGRGEFGTGAMAIGKGSREDEYRVGVREKEFLLSGGRGARGGEEVMWLM